MHQKEQNSPAAPENSSGFGGVSEESQPLPPVFRATERAQDSAGGLKNKKQKLELSLTP